MWGGFCLIFACSILFLSSFFHLLCSSLNLTRIVCALFLHACVCVWGIQNGNDRMGNRNSHSHFLCVDMDFGCVSCAALIHPLSHTPPRKSTTALDKQTNERESGRIISAHKKNFDGSFGFGFLYSYCIILIFNRILYKSNVEKRDFRFYFLVLISHPPKLDDDDDDGDDCPDFYLHRHTHNYSWHVLNVRSSYEVFTRHTQPAHTARKHTGSVFASSSTVAHSLNGK